MHFFGKVFMRMTDQNDFQTILEFGSLRKGSTEHLWKLFINDRYKELILDPPITNPDQAVINVLHANGIYEDQLHNYQFRTGLTRQAQNMVGDMLERFLFYHLKDWIWCSGAIVPHHTCTAIDDVCDIYNEMPQGSTYAQGARLIKMWVLNNDQ